MNSLSHAVFDLGFCEEHLDELLHLVRVRERAILVSDITLTELVRLDKRVLGHLRGLTLRNPVAWKCLVQRIEQSGLTTELLFAAGVVALTNTERDQHDMFFAWLRTTALPHALARSIGRWVPLCRAVAPIQWTDYAEPHLSRLFALTMATSASDADAAVAATSRQSSVDVLVAVANAVHAFNLRRFSDDMETLTNHPDGDVKHAALIAMLRFKPSVACERIWQLGWEQVDDPQIFYRAATVLPSETVPKWAARLDECGKSVEALLFAAFSGLPSMLGHLQGRTTDAMLLDVAALCRLAITGSESRLTSLASGPEGFVEQSDGLAEAEHKESSVFGVRANYENTQEHFLNGDRTTSERALFILREGFQLQRAIASYWLDSHCDAHGLDILAPAFVQIRHMAACSP